MQFNFNKYKRWSASLLALGAISGATLIASRTPGRADATSYSSERRQIKACVLVSSAASILVGGSQVKENSVPHVFYVMDRRQDLKPAGWEFVNPLASSTITGDIVNRWNKRDNTDPSLANPAFAIGAPLTKNIGAYWEVDLDGIAADDLRQFDIVLIAVHNNSVAFNADQREKIRKYVDGGGTIWLENEGGADINKIAPFLLDVGFSGAYGAGQPQVTTTHHPLVNFPFGLTSQEIQYLGAGEVGTHRPHYNNWIGGTTNVNPSAIVPIVTKSGLPLVSAGDYGAGHIVISSTGIATGINSYVGGALAAGFAGNSGAVSGEVLLGVLPTDIKFAYNMMAWTSSVPTQGVNSRRSGGSGENIGSDLGRKFQTLPITGASGLGSGAVIHKGVVFWIDGNSVLHAYDASPGTDLDNDKIADDGIPDYILGAPYDEIWRTDLSGALGSPSRLSAPTIVSVNQGGIPVDCVVVTGSNGVTVALDAFPRDNAGHLLQTSTIKWTVKAETGKDIGGELANANSTSTPSPAPAVSDGVLFTLVNYQGASAGNFTWRVVAIDPLTGNEIFSNSQLNGMVSGAVGLAPSANFAQLPGLPSPVGSLTVGYVKDELSGALDKIVYVPSRGPNSDPTKGGDMVTGCLFSVKGEPLRPSDTNNPGVGQHQRYKVGSDRRSNYPWFLGSAAVDLTPVIYVNDKNNRPIARLVYGSDFTVNYDPGGPGGRQIVVTLTNPLTDDEQLFADYTLDWNGTALPTSSGNGGTITFPEMAIIAGRRFIIYGPDSKQIMSGTPALTGDDLLIINSGDFAGQDRIYAIHDQLDSPTGRNRGGNSLPVQWMFAPNGPSDDDNLGPGGLPARLVNIDPLVSEKDGAATLPNALNVIGTDFELIGSPSYINGAVYVTGVCHMRTSNTLGGSNTGYDATIVLALRANPTTSFTLTDNGKAIVIPQDATPVVLTQPNLAKPNSNDIVLTETLNFTLDRTTSSVNIFNMRSGGGAGDSFNMALPIYVRVGANKYGPILNPTTGFGPLDNLLWWMAIPINDGKNFVGGSILPTPELLKAARDIRPASGPTVTGDALYFGTTAGSVVSIDLTGIKNSGGQTKVYKTDGTFRLHSQPVVIDPANGLFPIAQPIINAPLATTGIAVAGSPTGLLEMDNQLTTIADSHRLIEVNHAGQAVHAIDSTQSVAISGGVSLASTDSGQIAGTKVSLSRPSAARHYTLNDYLLCDTGNNRVLQMGRGGQVNWELHSVNNDLGFLRPNDPLTLNRPEDVQTYTDSAFNGTISIKNDATGVTYSFTGYYFATHYLIADSGNSRGLEVVNVVDINNNPIILLGSNGKNVIMKNQVIFVTHSGEQNRSLRYRTIQQFVSPNANGYDTYIAASVDNIQQAGSDPLTTVVGNEPGQSDSPGGSVMLIHRFPSATDPFKDGDVAAVVNALAFQNANGTILTDANGKVLHQAINHPTYFRELNEASVVGGKLVPTLKYLLADANGVYLIRPQGAEAVIEWRLTANEYFQMTGRPLKAMSVQKLAQSDPITDSNGNIVFKPRFLITNSYSGLDSVGKLFNNKFVLAGETLGEVFEVRSDVYYTSGYKNPNVALYAPLAIAGNTILIKNPTSAITWMVPNETLPGLDKNGVPKYRQIQRTIGSATGATSSFTLEEPTHSDRPF